MSEFYELRLLPPFGPTRRVTVTPGKTEVVSIEGHPDGTEAVVLVLRCGESELETRDRGATVWRQGYPRKVTLPVEFRLERNELPEPGH